MFSVPKPRVAQEHLMSGAAEGLVAWLSYGVAELIHLTVFPWLTTASHLVAVPHPGFTALLMALYAVSGLASGIAISTLWPTLNGLTLRAATMTTMLALYVAAQGWYLSKRPVEQSGLYMALMCLALVWVATRTDRVGRLARPLSQPWAIASLVLTTPWLLIRFNDRHWGIATLVLAVCFCVAYALALLLQQRLVVQWNPWRRVVIGAGVAFGVWLAGSAIQQKPFRADHVAPSTQAGSNKPNVIVITLDTLRADHMSVYGYERDTTPNLEIFAREAVRYSRSFSSGDFTLSSHASLFTGLYPIHHGAHYGEKDFRERPLDDAHTTLAEILMVNGYATAAVVANPGYLSQTFGIAQGFAHYDQRSAVPFLRWIEPPFTTARAIRNVWTKLAEPRHFDQITRPAEDINASVYEQLAAFSKQKRPFFLFINYMDAHWPYIPPPPFDRKYPGLDKEFTLGQFFNLQRDVLHRNRKLTERQHRHLISQYDGGIAYLDMELGRLFTRLKESRLWDNTLIVVTSDHGEAFGDRDLMEHGVSVYQDQVHVPWLMKFPSNWEDSSSKGSTRTEPVSSVDLLPTVLDVVAIEAPIQRDGVSLARTIGKRTIYSESYPRQDLTKSTRFRRVERAVMTDHWKLVSSTAGKCELYDLDADPTETRNLCQSEEPLSLVLMQDIRSWRRRKSPEYQTSKKPDPATLERLRSLGYVQ